MRLSEADVFRLTRACRLAMEASGSEYIWDQYEDLIVKLEELCEQGYCSTTAPVNNIKE
tara:strand:- start:393 stop:569 length:177 start_codon:yes stop_codon:yes gene_type:complete